MSAQATTAARVGDHPGRWRGVRAPLVLAAAGGATAVALLVRSPHLPGSYGFCPFLALTGAYCPGCGGLRAVHDVLGGDLAGAWAMNPLVVVVLPVLVGLWARWAWRGWRGRPVAPPGTAAIVGLAVVLAVFTVARNLPALAPVLAP